MPLVDDKTLFDELFRFLNGELEEDRDIEVDSLRRYVDTARQIAKRQETLNNMDKKDNKYYFK